MERGIQLYVRKAVIVRGTRDLNEIWSLEDIL